MTANAAGNETLLKEWETARDVLKSFDERLHDLRKYGFSFITAMLAVEGWFSPKLLSSGPSASGAQMPDKELMVLIVVMVNLILICAVRVIERNYEVFQIAAAARALVLERLLNLELTEVICQRFKNGRVRLFVAFIYILFTVAVLVLGWSALAASRTLRLVIAVFCALAIVFILLVEETIHIAFPKGYGDWTLERVECTKGEKVGITLTNLHEKRSLAPDQERAWELTREGGGEVTHGQFPSGDFEIGPLDSYTWLLDTGALLEGIYRVRVLREIRTKKVHTKAVRTEKALRERVVAEKVLTEKVHTQNVDAEGVETKNELKPLGRKLRVKPKEPSEAVNIW